VKKKKRGTKTKQPDKDAPSKDEKGEDVADLMSQERTRHKERGRWWGGGGGGGRGRGGGEEVGANLMSNVGCK